MSIGQAAPRPARGPGRSREAARLFSDLMAAAPPLRRQFMAELTEADLQQVLAIAAREGGTPYALWRDDPVGFVTDVLHESTWSRPREIMSLIPQVNRVAVPSCYASGKTWASARLAIWFSMVHPPGTAKVVTMAPTWRQVVRLLWAEVRNAHSHAGLPGAVDMAQLKIPDESGTDQVVAYGLSAAPWNEAAVQGIHCFDHETELLTDEGWKPFPQVRGDERVLTLPPDSDVAEWGPITAVVRDPFDGYMNLHEDRGGRVNFCVTDNHRMLVRGRGKEYGRHGQITRSEADKIKQARAEGVSVHVLAEKYGVSTSLIYKIAQGARDHALTETTAGPRWRLTEYADLPETFIVRRTNTWGGGNPEAIVLTAPRETSYQPRRPIERYEFAFGDWCDFLGWFVAEGWTHQPKSGRLQVGISQKPGEKYEEIFALLQRMGLPVRRGGHDVRFTSDAVGLWLREHCGVGSFNKRIPKCVREARPEMIRRFLDAFGKGDGCAHTHAESRRYITSSPKLADDLHEAMAKLGTARKMRVMHKAGSVGKITSDGVERTFVRDKPTFMLNEAGRPSDSDVHKRNVRRVRYTGTVYCVSTPHQTIMVRRKGCTMWSGNSPKLLLIVDEAGGLSHTIGRNLRGMTSTEGSRMLAIGNPPTDEENSWFETLCEQDDVHVVPISAYDTPALSGEKAPRCLSCHPEDVHPVTRHLVKPSWVEETIREHGADSHYVQAKVYARFPSGGPSRAIPSAWIDAAAEREEPERGRDVVPLNRLGLPGERDTWMVPRRAWVRLGVDVAADGGDEMVICRAVGDLVTIRETSTGSANTNSVDVAGVILAEIRRAEALARLLGEVAPVRVKIDAIGIGWGVAGTLKKWAKEGKHGAQIEAVVVSEKPNRAPDSATLHPRRKRDEMWLATRALLEPSREHPSGQVRLRVDHRTLAQLRSPVMSTSSEGFTEIESKKSLRARGLSSPDRAEALLLCLYEPGPAPRRRHRARLIA